MQKDLNAREKRYQQEIKEWQEELRNESLRAAKAAYCLGNIYFIKLKFGKALQYYQRAVELNPDEPKYQQEISKLDTLLTKDSKLATLLKENENTVQEEK